MTSIITREVNPEQISLTFILRSFQCLYESFDRFLESWTLQRLEQNEMNEKVIAPVLIY